MNGWSPQPVISHQPQQESDASSTNPEHCDHYYFWVAIFNWDSTTETTDQSP